MQSVLYKIANKSNIIYKYVYALTLVKEYRSETLQKHCILSIIVLNPLF